MAIDNKGFAMFGSYYTAGVGDLNVLFGSWGLLADFSGLVEVNSCYMFPLTFMLV